MPVYEYKCVKCGNIFDAFQRIGANGSDLNCPSCGAPGPEKLFSSFASANSAENCNNSNYGGCGTSGFG